MTRSSCCWPLVATVGTALANQSPETKRAIFEDPDSLKDKKLGFDLFIIIPAMMENESNVKPPANLQKKMVWPRMFDTAMPALEWLAIRKCLSGLRFESSISIVERPSTRRPWKSKFLVHSNSLARPTSPVCSMRPACSTGPAHPIWTSRYTLHILPSNPKQKKS